MTNPTHVPVRRVRTVSAYNSPASVAEAAPVDAENAEEYDAYESYEAYESQDGYEEYDQYEEPQRAGLFSSPARALALGSSVLALLLVFAVAIFIVNGNTKPIPNPPPGDVPVISNISQSGALSTGSVPPNFEWTDANGNTVSLASLKGKSVWINFWGTWCPPCRAEMPAMEKVYSKHKDELIILGVSMAPRDDPGVVSQFLKQNPYSWTFIHDGDQGLAMRYQAGSIPMSYFIGPDGVVKAASMGAIPEELMENFIAQAKQ
jgi:thiol-disulfide isomerase/thioredoxin